MEKSKLLEYYSGNPDTIEEYDNETKAHIRSWYYDKSKGISFGYFSTSLDGEKEFIAEKDSSHNEISNELTKRIIGKAIACEDVDDDEIENVRISIYGQAAYKGRTFDEPRVVTTWHKVSSNKLAELLNLIGGVDKFGDYTYVYEEEYGYDGNERADGNSMNVIDYINSNDAYVSAVDEKKMSMKLIDSWSMPSWLAEVIRTYNAPNSTLAAKTERLGNMTIAQYNSLIHQEEKEPKKTIKENISNMKNSKHQEEFSNYLKIMNEALKKEDFNAYKYVKDMLEEAIEENKHEKELMNELNTTNFGILNHIFESELPTLIKTNKKGVREVIKTIKEDKNLKNQFSFYNVIKEQYDSKHAEIISPEMILEKLTKIVCENIDLKTVKASNNKLRKVMIENNIIPSDFVDDESRKLYESGNIILTKKKSTNNMIPLIESYDAVCKWMTAHKDDKKDNGQDVDTLIEEFENKLKTNLNESEMSFVQEITDFRSPIAEKRKENLFNKFKNECISKINDMLKEDSENTELKGLSDQINEMTFNKDSIVKDIAKLLEIRDILMDD